MINLLAKIFAWFRYVPYEERRAREAAKLKEAHDTAYSDAYFRMMVRGFSDIAIGAVEAELRYIEEFSHLCSTEAARAQGIQDAIDAARVKQATRNFSAAPPAPSLTTVPLDERRYSRGGFVPQDPDYDAEEFEYLTQAYRSQQTRQRKEEEPEHPTPTPAPTGRRMRVRGRKKP